MKTPLLRSRYALAAMLSLAALPVMATPLQYSFDFSFSGFTSMGVGQAVPYDPVVGNVALTLDLAANPNGNQGFVDSFTLSAATPAFGTTGVQYILSRGPANVYWLSLGRVVPTPPGHFGADLITNVFWGTDDFNMTISDINFLNAGGHMVYTNPNSPDDAWITWSGQVSEGTLPGPDPIPGSGVPEPGSLALVCLGLLGVGSAFRPRNLARTRIRL